MAKCISDFQYKREFHVLWNKSTVHTLTCVYTSTHSTHNTLHSIDPSDNDSWYMYDIHFAHIGYFFYWTRTACLASFIMYVYDVQVSEYFVFKLRWIFMCLFIFVYRCDPRQFSRSYYLLYCWIHNRNKLKYLTNDRLNYSDYRVTEVTLLLMIITHQKRIYCIQYFRWSDQNSGKKRERESFFPNC